MPRFKKYFLVNVELQRIVLAAHTESDEYLKAIGMFEHHARPHLEMIANDDEIVEMASQLLKDRAIAGTCRWISKTILKYALQDAANKIYNRRTAGNPRNRLACERLKDIIANNVDEGRVHRLRESLEQNDGITLYEETGQPLREEAIRKLLLLDRTAPGRIDYEDDEVHANNQQPKVLALTRNVLQMAFGDLLVIARRSWCYFHLAGHRYSGRGWRGVFARDYLLNGNQATVSQDQNRLIMISGEKDTVLQNLLDDTLPEDTGLFRFVNACHQEVEAKLPPGTQVTEELRVDLAGVLLKSLRQHRPKAGYGCRDDRTPVAQEYRLFARELDSLAEKLSTDERIQIASQAVGEVIQSGYMAQAQGVEYEACGQWLALLPESHLNNERSVEDVLAGVPSFARRVADAPVQDVEGQPHANPDRDRHREYFEQVSARISQQEYQEPERTALMSLWKCESRQATLANFCNDSSTGPNSLIQNRKELLPDDALIIIQEWAEEADVSKRPAEIIFDVSPGLADLKKSREFLQNLTDEDVAAPERWNHLAAEQKFALIAMSLGVFDRLQSYLDGGDLVRTGHE